MHFPNAPSENAEEILELFKKIMKEAVEILNNQRLPHLTPEEREQIVQKAKNKYNTENLRGPKGFITFLSKELNTTPTKLGQQILELKSRIERRLRLKLCETLDLPYPKSVRVNGKELYVALTEAKQTVKIPETPPQKMKYLKDIVEPNDIKYALELYIDNLSRTTPRNEKEKMRKTIEEEIKEYKKYLEKALNMLLEERIEALNDDEVNHIIQATREEYPTKRKRSERKKSQERQKNSELWILQPLAKEFDIHKKTLINYFRPRKRVRMSRYKYLRICDALKLDLTDRKHVRVSREQFLNTFFRSESKLMQEEREELWGTKEERLEAHWSQQPPGTRCIFFEKDIKILRNVVLELCDGNIKELTRRIRDDMGIQHITSRRIRAFIENETLETDVELLLALIGVIIGSKPEEVSELIQNKTLAETFRNSMLKKNLVNEENMEWVENLPSDLMREISLENLAEEQQKRIETPEDTLTFLEEIREKGIIFGEFYVCITRQEVDKLKDAINKARREENSQKKPIRIHSRPTKQAPSRRRNKRNTNKINNHKTG